MTTTREKPATFKEEFRKAQNASNEKRLIKRIRNTIAKTPPSSDVIIIEATSKWELSWCLGHDWELLASIAPQFEGTAGITRHTLKRDRAWAQYEVELWEYERKHGKVVA